ncbi:hypothetical protein [Geoalkalibacter halelectricus]|uniref:Site-specific DNA-methyltransferase (adenine-specific) n=1 Tax=Geoalkalibacter halelectricus TaxID=2847045 RepID=A0ABY5ZN54_9BACT|nr:hypothetical protein [Geoalkalibacter halelectricus]MDO3379874.1 hypothetical protein [Geoalkalibacter halelectricus]UWZ80597.1 hypothetical protein L9S41_04155 [Geoalkalibacter halelectricus]
MSEQKFLQELEKKLWNAADKLPPGTKIEIKNGKTEIYEMRGIGRLIDDALVPRA